MKLSPTAVRDIGNAAARYADARVRVVLAPPEEYPAALDESEAAHKALLDLLLSDQPE